MNRLPPWITIAEIKRFNALKEKIFQGDSFVIHDDDNPEHIEYNALALKILRLRRLSAGLADLEEERVSYGGLAVA